MPHFKIFVNFTTHTHESWSGYFVIKNRFQSLAWKISDWQIHIYKSDLHYVGKFNCYALKAKNPPNTQWILVEVRYETTW